ncbi:hypothetical protein AC249_AIPGENE22969 [Exaiptasia diaphana]|nr:hypothetical protein AC249_AIPGENE22969 [Exaiptasia diaphana]
MKWLPFVVILITMAAGSSSLQIRCDFNSECRDFGLKSCCNNTCNARQYCSRYCDSPIDCLPNEDCLNSLCTSGRLLHRLRRSRTSSSQRCHTQEDCPGKRCSEYYQECFSCGCEEHEDCIKGKCVKVREVGQISSKAIVNIVLLATLVTIVVTTIVIACSFCFCPCCCCKPEQEQRPVPSLPIGRAILFLRQGEGIQDVPVSHGIPGATTDGALVPTHLAETVGNTENHELSRPPTYEEALPSPPTYEEATTVI